ncbi:MAG: D-glucuronyl C5-epimerase family protein [Anaerolineales bacterium]
MTQFLRFLYSFSVLLLLGGCATSAAPTPRPTTPPPTASAARVAVAFPADGGLVGLGLPVVLAWADEAPLADDELYAVQLAPAGQSLQDIQWTRGYSFDASVHIPEPGQYTWQVLRIALDDSGAYAATVAQSHPATFNVPADEAEFIANLNVPINPEATQPCPAELRQPLPEVVDYELQPGQEALGADGGVRFVYGGHGYTVFPLQTAWYGRGALLEWCNRDDPVGLQLAVQQAEWLVEQAIWQGDVAYIPYGYPAEEYGAPAGWWSGLAHAEIIHFLGDIMAVAPNPTYARLITGLLAGYNAAIPDGGVVSTLALPDGPAELIWYEEYAHPDIINSHVLNGHLAALQSLDAYAQQFRDARVTPIVERGLASAAQALSAFDGQSISYYALNVDGYTVSSNREHYAHGVHISTALWAYAYSGEAVFLEYALRWAHDTRVPYPMTTYRNALSSDNRLDAVLASLPSRGGVTFNTSDVEALIFDLGQERLVSSLTYSILGSPTWPERTTFPSAVSLATSSDGQRWQSLAEYGSITQSAQTLRLDTPTFTRYVRLTWDALDNPAASSVILGMHRLDGPAHWRQPVVLTSNGQLLSADAERQLGAEDVIYMDLLDTRAPEFVNLAAAEWAGEVSMQVSSDLITWQTVLDAAPWDAEGRFALPADATWRYARLSLRGAEPINLDAVTFSGSS